MSCVFLFQLTGQAAFDVLSNHVSRTISNNDNAFGVCGRFPESRSGRLKLNKIGKFSISARSCVCAHAQRSEIWLISTEFYRANSQDSVFCLKVDVFLLTHAFVASFWDQILHAEHHIQHRPAHISCHTPCSTPSSLTAVLSPAELLTGITGFELLSLL